MFLDYCLVFRCGRLSARATEIKIKILWWTSSWDDLCLIVRESCILSALVMLDKGVSLGLESSDAHRRGVLLSFVSSIASEILIKHQTNWVWASLPLLWQWKCFVLESCANYTRRCSCRNKSAPVCPKSSCFSLQKCAREALGMAGVSEHVLEQIVDGHSPEQRRHSEEWLWSQHGEALSEGQACRGEQLGMWGCSAVLTQRQGSEMDFPVTTIPHLWHFGKRGTIFWKIKP